MEKDFCIGCKGDMLPPCILSKRPIKHTFESLITNIWTPTYVDLYTCPVDAQDYKNNKLIINERCIECGICLNRCVFRTGKKYNPATMRHQKIFSSLHHVRLYLETMVEGYAFFDEVATEGNSRTKRVDILAINNKNAKLIKVMQNENKRAFYVRSYKSILENYENNLAGRDTEILILTPGNLAPTLINNSNNKAYTVGIQKIKGFMEDKYSYGTFIK